MPRKPGTTDYREAYERFRAEARERPDVAPDHEEDWAPHMAAHHPGFHHVGARWTRQITPIEVRFGWAVLVLLVAAQIAMEAIFR